jgi:hypothetical protein
MEGLHIHVPCSLTSQHPFGLVTSTMVMSQLGGTWKLQKIFLCVVGLEPYL